MPKHRPHPSGAPVQPPRYRIDPTLVPVVAVPPRQGLAIRRGLGWDTLIVELDPLSPGGGDRLIEVPINADTGKLLQAFLLRQARRNGIPSEQPPQNFTPKATPVRQYTASGRPIFSLEDI